MPPGDVQNGVQELIDVLLMASTALDAGTPWTAAMPLDVRRQAIPAQSFRVLTRQQRRSRLAREAARDVGAAVTAAYETLYAESVYVAAALLRVAVEATGRPPAEVLHQAIGVNPEGGHVG